MNKCWNWTVKQPPKETELVVSELTVTILPGHSKTPRNLKRLQRLKIVNNVSVIQGKYKLFKSYNIQHPFGIISPNRPIVPQILK
jgi:hypothetical protein